MRILALDRMRKLNTAVSMLDCKPMPLLDMREMLAQRTHQAIRQHSDPILRALAVAHNDLAVFKFDVFDTEPQRFQQAQTGAVKEACDEPMLAAQLGQHRSHFRGREDDWEVPGWLRPDNRVQPWQLDLENLTVQKQDGRQRLILGRGRNSALNREVTQKRLHFLSTQFGWVPLMVKENKATDPAEVLLLGPIAVMKRTQAVTHLVEEPRLGFHAA